MIFIDNRQNRHNSKKIVFKGCEAKMTKMIFDHVKNIFFFSVYYLI